VSEIGAILQMVEHTEGHITNGDMGMNALGFPMKDRPHLQGMLVEAKGLFNDSQSLGN